MEALPTAGFGLIDLFQYGLAVVLGVIIGWERETRHKPAGWKTTTFVTVAGTLIMKLSLHLITIGEEIGSFDVSRLGAAAITGIGFLGAGVILQQRDKVRGLTTAAAIWMMTAVGLAIGAGYYWHAITVVALMTLIFKTDELLDRNRRRDDVRDVED